MKQCDASEYRCESDGACIADYKVCNGYKDCSDKSDEKNCLYEADDDGDYGNLLHSFIVLINAHATTQSSFSHHTRSLLKKYKYLLNNKELNTTKQQIQILMVLAQSTKF